jgi:hypothetical protein
MESPNFHYRIDKSPSPVLILSQKSLHYASPSHFLKIHSNIILPSTLWVLQVVLSITSAHQILYPCIHLSNLSYVLHAPPISLFSIWSPERYLVRSSAHKAPRCVVFSIPLFPCHSALQNFYIVQFLGEELLATWRTSNLEDPPPVGCPRLLIQYIRSYPPYRRPFLHPQTVSTRTHLSWFN